MDTRTAARRWALTWAEAWPKKDVEAIVALQAPDGVHHASLFRSYQGRDGLREYVAGCFAAEVAPAETRFADPWVDADSAAAEYWVVMHLADGPVTISGCTVLRFDADGLVTEARDYSHLQEGRHEPPVTLFTAFPVPTD
jgi:ketosteroid isomerase-like protein